MSQRNKAEPEPEPEPEPEWKSNPAAALPLPISKVRQMKLLDTHVHLWPGTAVESSDHAWMTPGLPGNVLAKRQSIIDYNAATENNAASTRPPDQQEPHGLIYVETDRHLPPTPHFTWHEIEAAKRNPECVTGNEVQEYMNTRDKLIDWASKPLEELVFLRRIVEDTPKDGDGFEPGDGERMLGCVVWAPFHIPHSIFRLYLTIVREVAGPVLWNRIVGFRYLVQHFEHREPLEQLFQSDNWLQNIGCLKSGREGTGWTFDIGVDAHGHGVWQVEAAAEMVRSIREKEKEPGQHGRVKFILNHLCKPDLTTRPCLDLEGPMTGKRTTPHKLEWDGQPVTDFAIRWQKAMELLAAQPDVYMKLSGGLNEMDFEMDDGFQHSAYFNPDHELAVSYTKIRSTFISNFCINVPNSRMSYQGAKVAHRLGFYVRTACELFGPRRIMFGSDWPVCNIGGPNGETSSPKHPSNWELWRQAVIWCALTSKLSESDTYSILWETGCAAYRVELFNGDLAKIDERWAKKILSGGIEGV